ncbi:MAG TPA: tRNA pseudouridine(55) synthase TruB [Sphingomonadaceae bacterium]|nr:tRNA pseudouridine(55) synthase TruB [Sphingomonadaceae bacterium]
MIDKPVGLGSTPLVSAVKRALRAGGYAKVKVGHGGTLDPLANGVLPIALGEATKLAGRMLDADKAYNFTIRFGEETSTLDREGEVVARSDVRPSRAAVEAVLARFTGEIAQVPPAYSALLIDGRRAYDRARAGEVVELATRLVTVHALRLCPTPTPPLKGRGFQVAPSPQAPPLQGRGWGWGLDEATLSARVSKGTYIRSLARDIARALGTFGHVTMLRRVQAGPFSLTAAISLDKLAELAMAGALEQALLPLTSALDDIPALPVTPDQASALRQGRTIGIAVASDFGPGFAFATLDAVPVAYVEIEDARMRVVRGFNL